jgi:OmpA-OmpF porin, OOP family
MRRWTKRLIACAALLLAAVPAWALSPFFVFFDRGSVRFDTQDEAILDNAFAAIRFLDVRSLEIAGHTDRVGSEADNVALSRRRAEAVRDALLARGMSPRVEVRIVAAGEADPLVETADGVPEPQNRHVSIIFYGMCTTNLGRERLAGPECQTPLHN